MGAWLLVSARNLGFASRNGSAAAPKFAHDGARDFAAAAGFRMSNVPANPLLHRGVSRHDVASMPCLVQG
jgi:hypothetical protein